MTAGKSGHDVDIVVIHEHPEWQKPLFEALDKRGVSWAPFDLKQAVFGDHDVPTAKVYFNQASPSAYLRGNTRAVTLGLAYLRQLQWQGKKVLNGADVFAFELSKTAQNALLGALGIDHPKSLSFNSIEALRTRADELGWPALIKPEQGGSGARIGVVDSFADVEAAFADESIWAPDNLFLLQEYLPHDPAFGIVRLEFLGGQLLYAMRVVTHGRFNLCPAPVCNPDDDGVSICEIPAVPTKPVEFYPYKEVPDEAVATAKKIFAAAKLDVGGIEYLETPDGRRVFYDVNANSNLRPSIANAFGFDPFERVVDYLVEQVEREDKAASGFVAE